MKRKQTIATSIAVSLALVIGPAWSQQVPLEDTSIQRRSDLKHGEGFVSRGDSVMLLLNAIGTRLKTPVVASALVKKKTVTGSFDLKDPERALNEIGGELGLIWFNDGQSLYVYDASEIRNVVGNMRHASISTLNDFLRKAGLEDKRYPIRGSGADGTFYVSGPAVYVDIVSNAARYLDRLYRGVVESAEHVEVIKLENSFVQGRRYGLRGTETTLPSLAVTLQSMLSRSGVESRVMLQADDMDEADTEASVVAAGEPAQSSASQTLIVPYPETNSLLVRGTLSQVQMIKRLVAELDKPRSQIELSLYIIDIKKTELDKLGALWAGEVGISGRLGVSFNQNGNVSTLDGGRFLASISALSETGSASIVSRPVILTQENVVAHFDSNNTFYTPLLGERNTSLESVTYGTLISVLPRISSDLEVEMQLKIEDGTATGTGQVNDLPVVARTSIDTVARVPHELSLLVGGYTREVQEQSKSHVPGLSRLPLVGGAFRNRNDRSESVVRVFLIEPRVLTHADMLSPAQRSAKYGTCSAAATLAGPRKDLGGLADRCDAHGAYYQ